MPKGHEKNFNQKATIESDSFFYQLMKRLPDTLPDLLGQPPESIRKYQFLAPEMKKSLRLDGLMVPNSKKLPLYFLEVQFQRNPAFYANLFAKVFWYLGENEPAQDWRAVAIFSKRSAEPKELETYKEMLAMPRVRRIYLNELPAATGASPGLTILRLIKSDPKETAELTAKLLLQAEQEQDGKRSNAIVQLMEEMLIRRYSKLNREEIRRMFKLTDIRKTRVWEEAREEGVEEGIEKGIVKGIVKGRELEKQDLIKQLHLHGQTYDEIAKLLKISLAEVRRLAKG